MCGQEKVFDARETEIREYMAAKWEAILTFNDEQEEQIKPLKELLLWDLRTDGACSANVHQVSDWLYENFKDDS